MAAAAACTAAPGLAHAQGDKPISLIVGYSAGGSADRRSNDVESAPVRVSLPADGVVELVIGATRD
jgi:tripartite-type tricarboxylate transporter receptor subunit TctC